MARNLVAILAADIVGYSKLMDEDEENTLISLRAFKNEILTRLFSTTRVQSLRAWVTVG